MVKISTQKLMILQGIFLILVFCLLRTLGIFEPLELFYFNFLSKIQAPEQKDNRIVLIGICEQISRQELVSRYAE